MICRLFFAGCSSLALVFALAVPVASAEPFQTNEDPVSTVESGQDEELQDGQPEERQDPDIIRKPGAGRYPEDSGDRGGVLQVVLFVAVAGGITVIVALALRESRRNRSRL